MENKLFIKVMLFNLKARIFQSAYLCKLKYCIYNSSLNNYNIHKNHILTLNVVKIYLV